MSCSKLKLRQKQRGRQRGQTQEGRDRLTGRVASSLACETWLKRVGAPVRVAAERGLERSADMLMVGEWPSHSRTN